MGKSSYCAGALCMVLACSQGEPNDIGSGNLQGTSGVSGQPIAGGSLAGTGSPVGAAGGMNATSAGAAGASAAGSGPSAMPAGTGGMAITGGEAGDGMSAGTGGMTPPVPGPGGLPRADDVNTEQMGPYAFESFTEGTDNPAYGSAILYYPTDATPPFAAVVFSPGFTATKESYQDFLGPLLASHGIVMMLTTPTTTADLPNARGADLEAAIEQIAAVNQLSGSPVEGKLAPDRVCVTGHSMGGGGSLWAASSLGEMLRCAVPLQPWQPGTSFSSIAAPIMFITGQSDAIAGNASNSRVHYGSIPETVPKYYVEFAGADHYLTTNTRGSNYAVQSRYMIAFYKVYLEDDMRYLEFLDAEPDPELSDYQKSQ